MGLVVAQRNPLQTLAAKIAGNNGRSSSYDPILAAATRRSQAAISDIQRQFHTGSEEAKIGYDEERQGLQEQKIANYEQNTGNFAGRGLLRSGIFAMEQGKVGKNFQSGLTAAAERRQRTIQGLTNARLSGLNNIQSALEEAQGAAAERANQAAAREAQQAMATQQAQQLLAIQQQSMNDQRAIAQQQLAMYRSQMGSGGSSGGGGYGMPAAPAQSSGGLFGRLLGNLRSGGAANAWYAEAQKQADNKRAADIQAQIRARTGGRGLTGKDFGPGFFGG